jgi:small GTP-binding protein
MSNEGKNDYDIIYKIVLIGDSSVGKTNIFSKYLNDEFDPDSKATVGVEFGTKDFKIEEKLVKVQIWDTAGQERYRSITNAYYKGAKGCLLVYDITNKFSFESLDRWLDELKNNGDSDISIMLVGNKNDLESDRAISLEEGKNFAEFHKMAFIETSALNGNNIEKAFSELISDVYKSQNFSSNKKDNIKLNEKTINIENVEQKDEEKEEPLAKKGCCS